MAVIDKTYLKYQDYLILKEWCENTKLIYSDGKEGSPKDFLYLYTEPYKGKLPVWNTPWAFDDWLRNNCPLDFIQKRLNEQYGNKPVFEDVESFDEPGTHYIYITKPNYKVRDKWWTIEDFQQLSQFKYNYTSKKWNTLYDLVNPNDDTSYILSIKNLTKRKLNRLVRKWKLPKGTTLKIESSTWLTPYFVIMIV